MYINEDVMRLAKAHARNMVKEGKEQLSFSPDPTHADERVPSFHVQKNKDGIMTVASFEESGETFFVGVAK